MKYRRTRVVKGVLCALSCLGMLVPTPGLQAATPEPSAGPAAAGPVPVVSDLALQESDLLLGQVVSAAGRPLPGMTVSLRQLDREVAATTTDASGCFSIGGLRGGVYEMKAGPVCRVYRIWAPNTAPPSAQRGAIVVIDEQLLRGQSGPMAYWLGKPLLLAGIVAAAVAIPIIIHNNRVRNSSSP